MRHALFRFSGVFSVWVVRMPVAAAAVFIENLSKHTFFVIFFAVFFGVGGMPRSAQFPDRVRRKA